MTKQQRRALRMLANIKTPDGWMVHIRSSSIHGTVLKNLIRLEYVERKWFRHDGVNHRITAAGRKALEE